MMNPSDDSTTLQADEALESGLDRAKLRGEYEVIPDCGMLAGKHKSHHIHVNNIMFFHSCCFLNTVFVV